MHASVAAGDVSYGIAAGFRQTSDALAQCVHRVSALKVIVHQFDSCAARLFLFRAIWNVSPILLSTV